MNSRDTPQAGMGSEKSFPVVLTPKETAAKLKVSLSWLAKARMRGDGPPYAPVGRSIRYPEIDLIEWMRSQRRTSTSSPPSNGR